MKPVLFIDFYKTLSVGRFWYTADSDVCAQINKLIFNTVEKGSVADLWMRGEKTSEEVSHYLSEILDIPYEMLWELFMQSVQTIGIHEDALELISQLREKYTTVLITDNMDCFTRFIVPTYKLDTVFDHIINSADVGIRKEDRNGKIFTLVTNDFPNCTIIDDSEHVCKFFEQHGGKAFHVQEREDTVKYLKSLI